MLLICVPVPALSLYIANEFDLIMKKEFILSTKVLGGRKFFIFYKHVWPYMRKKVFLLFFQQCSQMMILLTQLGVFHIFLGGGIVTSDPTMGSSSIYSFSNEWSGLIGASSEEIFIAPWIVLAPLLLFAISIFMMNMIHKQIEEIMEGPKLSVKVERKEKKAVYSIDKSSFEMVKHS